MYSGIDLPTGRYTSTSPAAINNVAVSEVYQAQYAVNQRVAYGNERILTACGYSGQQCRNSELHLGLSFLS